jgi:hypothetical protein
MMIQHNTIDTIGQEFYRWPLVTQAARNALEIRSEFRYKRSLILMLNPSK